MEDGPGDGGEDQAIADLLPQDVGRGPGLVAGSFGRLDFLFPGAGFGFFVLLSGLFEDALGRIGLDGGVIERLGRDRPFLVQPGQAPPLPLGFVDRDFRLPDLLPGRGQVLAPNALPDEGELGFGRPDGGFGLPELKLEVGRVDSGDDPARADPGPLDGCDFEQASPDERGDAHRIAFDRTRQDDLVPDAPSAAGAQDDQNAEPESAFHDAPPVRRLSLRIPLRKSPPSWPASSDGFMLSSRITAGFPTALIIRR